MASNSNAERIREYAREFLASGKEKSYNEIVEYIKGKVGGLYTPGMYSGALKSLADNEDEFVRTRRGFYQRLLPKTSTCNNPSEMSKISEGAFDLIIENTVKQTKATLETTLKDALMSELEKMFIEKTITYDIMMKMIRKIEEQKII